MVSCAYGAVRLEGLLAFAAGLLGLDVAVMTMVIVAVLASANHGSKKVLTTMKTAGRISAGRSSKQGQQAVTKVFHKAVRSLRHLRVSIGSSFYYEQGIVLATLQIMLKSCVDLIILH